MAAGLVAACSETEALPPATDGSDAAATEMAVALHPATHSKFLHLSDIHFDPLYIRHVNGYSKAGMAATKAFAQKLEATDASGWEALFIAQGSTALSSGHHRDTNYLLLKATLAAAQKAESYDYILYSGDYLAHDFVPTAYTDNQISDARAFAAKTVEFVNLMIEQEFSGTPIVSALGNNDSGLSDYGVKPGGEFLGKLSKTLPSIQGDAAATALFAKEGYYTIPHPTVANHDFIALGIYWTHSGRRNCGDTGAAADGTRQLAFLDSALKASKAAGRTATLLMHIPPGVDGYSGYAHEEYETGVSRRYAKDSPMWCTADKFETDFETTIATYSDILSAGFAGHTHMDEFRVVGAGATPDLAVRMSPSVTTFNGNNPSFTIFDYDTSTGLPTDYSVNVLSNPGSTPDDAIWNFKYTFSSAYNASDYTPTTMATVAANIRNDTNGARGVFTANYNAGGSLPSRVPDSWKYFACALDEMNLTDYKACLTDPTS